MAEIGQQAGEAIYSFVVCPIYAARSKRLELCSIETGAALILSCLSMNRISVNRIRGLIASLRRARRNTSMKRTAALQTIANAIDPITLGLEQGKGQDRRKVQLTEFNEM